MFLTPILQASAKTAATATVRAVKRRTLIPTRAALTLTPTAVSKVKQIVESKKNCLGLQIGVKKRNGGIFS